MNFSPARNIHQVFFKGVFDDHGDDQETDNKRGNGSRELYSHTMDNPVKLRIKWLSACELL